AAKEWIARVAKHVDPGRVERSAAPVEAGPREVQIARTNDCGAERRPEPGVAARSVDARDLGGLVGVGRLRGPDRLARDRVGVADADAGCEHVLEVGRAALVDVDRPVRQQLAAGLREDLGARPNARGHQDQLDIDPLAAAELERDDLLALAPDRVDAVPDPDIDAALDQRLRGPTGRFGRELGQQLRAAFDQRDLEPATSETIRGLDPIIAATEDRHPPRALFEDRVNSLQLGRVTQKRQVRRTLAEHRREHRAGPERIDQRVVADHALAGMDLALAGVEPLDADAGPNLDVVIVTKEVGRVRGDVGPRDDLPRQVIRHAADRIADRPGSLEQDDLRAVVSLARVRGCGRATEGAAEDHDLAFGHLGFASSPRLTETVRGWGEILVACDRTRPEGNRPHEDRWDHGALCRCPNPKDT